MGRWGEPVRASTPASSSCSEERLPEGVMSWEQRDPGRNDRVGAASGRAEGKLLRPASLTKYRHTKLMQDIIVMVPVVSTLVSIFWWDLFQGF